MMTCLYAVLLAFLPMFLIIAVGMSVTSPHVNRRPRDSDPGAKNRIMK